MSDKFKNKYRIPSARLKNWDYKSQAAYFVTICTKDMLCYFGDITKGEMHFSDIGHVVNSEWLKTPAIRPDMNLVLDEFSVMPNHFHSIIVIGENEHNTQSWKTTDAGTSKNEKPASLRKHDNYTRNIFGPQSKNLSSIIGGFKSAVTKHARLIDPDFAWQPRFHDHVIRDSNEHERMLYTFNTMWKNGMTINFFGDDDK